MKKLSLSSVKEFLNRDEMRVISGGSGFACGMQFSCTTNSDCESQGSCKSCSFDGWCESY